MPAPSREHNVVFYRQGPNGGLMSVRPDGTETVLVAADAFPQAWWSPDGTRLAYAGHDDRVWIVNADGSGRRSLATPGILELAWAPDGRQFAATVRGVARDVFVLDEDGHVVRQLTETNTFAQYLAWSPDGSTVAYSANWELWTVPADGGKPVLISGAASAASWSPDGCQIAITSPDGAAIMRWDGSERRLLPDGASRRPIWSSSGDQIVLESIGGDGIVVVGAGNLTARRIFDGDAYGLQWSTDGSRIAFYAPEAGISTIRADGTALTTLSNRGNDVQPAW